MSEPDIGGEMWCVDDDEECPYQPNFRLAIRLDSQAGYFVITNNPSPPAFHNGRDWFKPSSWFERGDKDGAQTACSRECIETIAAKTGKTGVVLPI